MTTATRRFLVLLFVIGIMVVVAVVLLWRRLQPPPLPEPVWLPSVVPIPEEPLLKSEPPVLIATLATIDERQLRDLMPELGKGESLYGAWWIDDGRIGVQTSERRWLDIDLASGVPSPMPWQNRSAHLRQAARQVAGKAAAFRWERGRYVELVQDDAVVRRWDYAEESDDRRATVWIILDGSCLALGQDRFWFSWKTDEEIELCTGFRSDDLALFDQRSGGGYRYFTRRLGSGAVVDVQSVASDHLLSLRGLSSDERFLLNAYESADWGIVDRRDGSIRRPALMGQRVSVVHHPEELTEEGLGWLIQPRETDDGVVDIWATPGGHLLPALRITAQDRPDGWPFLRSIEASPDGGRLLICGIECLAVAELPTDVGSLPARAWHTYASTKFSVPSLAMHPSAAVVDHGRDVIDLRSGALIASDARLPFRQRTVFARRSPTVAYGVSNKEVVAWHWTTGKELWSVDLESPIDLLLDEESERCWVLLRKGTVAVFDLDGVLVNRFQPPEDLRRARRIENIPGRSNCVVVADSIRLLDSAGRWSSLPRVGDTIERYGGFIHERVERLVDRAVVGRNGRVVFVSSNSGRIEIQDLETGEALRSLPDTRIGGQVVYAFRALYTTPDGRRLICLAEHDGGVGWVEWDLIEMKQLAGRRLGMLGSKYSTSLRHPNDQGVLVLTGNGLHLLDWQGEVMWSSNDVPAAGLQ